MGRHHNSKSHVCNKCCLLDSEGSKNPSELDATIKAYTKPRKNWFKGKDKYKKTGTGYKTSEQRKKRPKEEFSRVQLE